MSKRIPSSLWILWVVVLLPLDLAAQTKKPSVKLIYGALTAANSPIWVAEDLGLFDKYGLDLQVIHGRGATPV